MLLQACHSNSAAVANEANRGVTRPTEDTRRTRVDRAEIGLPLIGGNRGRGVCGVTFERTMVARRVLKRGRYEFGKRAPVPCLPGAHRMLASVPNRHRPGNAPSESHVSRSAG